MLDEFDTITEENIFLFAARNYYNPLGIDPEEFKSDLNKFKYIKRLLNRYIINNVLNERLILNHLIQLANVFGIKPTLKILEFKLNKKEYWSILKPFLIFLKYIKNTEYTDIKMDENVINQLRKI